MKQQAKTLAIIGVLICSLSIYLNFSQSNQKLATSKHNSPQPTKILTKKDTNVCSKPIKKEIIPVAKTTIDSSSPRTIIQSEVVTDEIAVAPETEILEPTTDTEAIIKMPENSTNTAVEQIPVQLTADEASAAQTDPIVIDLPYQGNWKSLDGSRAIIGTQYGFKFENSLVGWLNRYSKNDAGLILGDTNYFTFYVRLTENDHLIIEKTDGTEFWEFTRNYQ
ncbi:hypothetical protein CYV26_02565 [Carnobacterium maltaromaticum]|uniref:hypothetical protein n=1 Tax=Carnobacterium maltaromaticum TaxID=2751 RepID=UPI000C77C599|nr:hypothetical protein [Carnobacterium maltaromaticum]PLS39130.1 hypothetical protein CYV33_00030 [Carnobacterium maltaromaticum]PLS39941.1 hypothetical protein CYV30_00030 [Carnobacterium maltaromaticum]PLS40278.1 hypothetical protein CYV31_00030 [Carnobacterium maltaromaticum]PLS45920.1 hypothetical protein CYV28_00030 [Carnobacterium maltaromaticum]PLS47072.1 hypothetical protein CYV27_02040 [Carnobacterium maltaromaticum]